jgi:hypothetical protein
MRVDIKVTAHGLYEGIERDIDKLEKELAYRIVDEARTLIDSSIPSGRLYRRGSFKRGESRGLRLMGRRARGLGTRIHRASAPGQPPAEDTGKTYRDITVRRMGNGTYRVRFGGAAGYLELGTQNMKPRPYIVPAIEKAIAKVFNGSRV